jgi:hypothetical protein
MKWPPYLLKMRFQNPERTFGLWLPLFLLWPVVLVFLLAVFIILLPFVLLALIFTWQSGWLESLFMSVPAVFRVLCNLSGMVVDVGGKQEHVYIEFR